MPFSHHPKILDEGSDPPTVYMRRYSHSPSHPSKFLDSPKPTSSNFPPVRFREHFLLYYKGGREREREWFSGSVPVPIGWDTSDVEDGIFSTVYGCLMEESEPLLRLQKRRRAMP